MDWYDAPEIASPLVMTALGAVVAAGAILDPAKRAPRLMGLALLLLAGTLIAPFLDETD
jgi:hypothetical protein